jgi:tetratricopeptide (TPR) repeat protein
MTKKLIFSLSLLLVVSSAEAQDLVDRIVNEICSCIDTVQNSDSLEVRVNDCANEAIQAILKMEIEDPEFPVSEDSIQKIVDAVQISLAANCPKIRDYILSYNEARHYSLSESEIANNFYYDGNAAYKAENYKEAVKLYKKAIKEDPEFIFAIDNLGLTYRKLGDNKKAVSTYEESLSIYPEGTYAILNQAIAYTYQKDYDSALKNYHYLINLYPSDPEGYYGAGKVLVMDEDYENAIDYVFIAHRIYTSQNSDFVKDTKDLTTIIYEKLKELGKLELFNQKVTDFGTTIN